MKSPTINKLLRLNYYLYEQEARSFADTRLQIWEKPVVDFIDNIKPCAKILDIGCGNARLLPQIILSQITRTEKTNNTNNTNYSRILHLPAGMAGNMRIEYLGVDSSKTLIGLNKLKYPDVKFKIENGLKIKYVNSFDNIFCIAVLHHIPSEKLQLKFLKNIHRALKTNGQVLISVWNRHQDKFQKYFNQEYKSAIIESIPRLSAFLSALIRELGRNDLIVPWRQSGYFRYIHAFTSNKLSNLAQKAGFKNIRCFYANKYGKTDKKNGLNIYLIASKSS